MNTTTSILIGVFIIIGIGGLVYFQTNEPIAPQNAQILIPLDIASSTEGITAAEIANHKDKSSCWTIINGNVYDLTSWIPKHPGGEKAILLLCGTDGSAKFNKQHGGSAVQEKALAGFKIGVAQ